MGFSRGLVCGLLPESYYICYYNLSVRSVPQRRNRQDVNYYFKKVGARDGGIAEFDFFPLFQKQHNFNTPLIVMEKVFFYTRQGDIVSADGVTKAAKSVKLCQQPLGRFVESLSIHILYRFILPLSGRRQWKRIWMFGSWQNTCRHFIAQTR